MIRLHLIDGTWHANFEGNAEIMRLFGTTILPTPFTSHTSAATVLAAIQKENPGVSVTIS